MKRAQKAAGAIEKVKPENSVNARWGKDGLQNEIARLRALLNEAHELVEAI